jgi:hypothetical protein
MNMLFPSTASEKKILSNGYKYNHLSKFFAKEHPISKAK